MAGNNDLKIRIIGTLNSQATTDEINKALSSIENKITKLKLDIQLDDKISKTLADFSKAMENHKKIAQDLNKVIKEEKQVTKEADGTIKEKIRQHLKSGEIIEKEISRANKKIKVTQDETSAIQQQNKAIQQQGELLKNKYKIDSEGNKQLKSQTFKDGNTTVTTNVKTGTAESVRNIGQETAATQRLSQSKKELRKTLSQLNLEGKVSSENLAKLNKAIDNSKNVQQVQRLEASLQNLNKVRENEHKLEMARQQAQVNAQRIQTTHKGFVDNKGVEQYLQSVNNLTPRTANLNQQLQKSSMQFQQVSQNAKTAAGAAQQAGMSFGEMLSTAMTKFPIWMISATLFYAPLRALEDMTTRLIEIDSLMVSIQRVMDMPDFKFDQLLSDAVTTADQLSSKLTDVLGIMNEFGRMGFNEDQLLDITKTAQTLQNISDLNATDAVNTLTAAMLNYNIAAKDSLQIADMLNEIDNNFAVSTKDLSDGIRRAASTAKTFGVDIQDLTGYIAAIGSTTRETGAVVGNGLKTIISRITTIDGAETMLNSANVAMRDMEGNIRPVSDILTDLAGNWKNLSSEQQQNIGVTLAGRHQLSRFYALLNNFSMAQDATATAINSSGSAMREQEKYANSLEARINRLDTAWNKFTLALGDAVLTDGLIASIEILNSITSTAADNMGVMGVSAGLLGGALTMLSTRFRVFTTSLIFGTSEMTRAQLATAGLTAGMGRLGIAMVGVRTALMGLAAATVVGVIFVGLGIAIEKLITAYSNAKQKQEEFEAAQVKNIDAITNNKAKTEELIDAYKKLSQEKENGKWNTDKEKEYLQIQQQLGDIFPSLVSHIDATGQAHLISSDAINQEIEATKELIELKKEETRLKAVENFENAISERDKIQEDIDARKADIENLKSYNDSWMATKGETQKHKETINQLKQEILGMESQFANSSMKINDDVLKTSEAFKRLEIDPQIKQSIDEFVSSLDFSNLNASELDAYSKKIAQTSDELQKAYDSGDRGGFNTAKDSLREYAQEFGATDLQAKSLNLTLDGVKQKNEELANATFAGRDGTEGLADSEYDLANAANSVTGAIDGETGALSGNTDAKFENVSASSILFGITEDQIKQMENAIMVVSMLSGQEGLNAEQKALLAQATGFLASMYPHLNGQIAENIGWINGQIGMMSSLNQASGGNAAVMMANQDSITKASVAAVNQRIMAYQTEIAALRRTYDAAIQMANDFEQATGEPAPFKAGIISVRNRLSDAQLGLAKANDTKLRAIYDSGVKSGAIKPVGGSGSKPKSGSKGSKGSKSTGSQREIEQHLTDKYAQAVDALNTKLEESEYKASKLSKTSKEYRAEIAKQINIQTQLKNLAAAEQSRLEKRNQALKKQLKSMGNYNNLSEKQKEKYNDIASEIDGNIGKINDLKSAYINANRSIDSALENMKEAYNKVADEIIDIYKETYEKQRDLAIDALDKEVEAFEKAHKDKMDMLQEELNQYEEIIRAQIDAIDKEEDDSSYEKELAQKQKEQQDITNRMNELSLNDTPEGRMKYAELEKQLAEKNTEIDEFVHAREIQLRKDALEQQLEDKREYIEGQQKLEDEAYEKGKTELDKKRDELNTHWENLLNDEREWTRIRAEILKGNVTEIQKDMLDFSNNIKENMSSIGQSISQNLIDKIKEAQGTLKGISGSSTSTTTPNTTGNKKSTNSKGTVFQPGFKSEEKKTSSTQNGNLPLRKKSGGFSAPSGGWNTGSIVDFLHSKGYYAEFSDREKLFKALKGSGKYEGNGSQNSWLLTQLKKVGKLETGGMTPNWAGKNGKLAFLHQNELLLNKDETKGFFKSVDVLKGVSGLLQKLVQPINLPSLKQPSVPNQVNISMPMTIENLHATKDGGNEFMKTINKGFKELGMNFDIR